MTALPTVLAIDPGAKPGAVELEWGTGRVLRVATTVAAALEWRPRWGIAVTELQWYFGAPAGGRRGTGRGAADVNDILKLAFRAGWQLRGVAADRYMALKPQVWRGNTNAGKLQVQARIARELTADERKLFAGIKDTRQGDVLDAIGIGRAAITLAPTTTAYDWKG